MLLVPPEKSADRLTSKRYVVSGSSPLTVQILNVPVVPNVDKLV